MLIDAVKAHDGKLEYLYVDIDTNPKIAELLRVSLFHFRLIFAIDVDSTCACGVLGPRW